jgi:hypothetical protein
MVHILFSNISNPSQLGHRSVRFQSDQAAEVLQAVATGISRFRPGFLAEPLPKVIQPLTQVFYFIQGQAPAFKKVYGFIFGVIPLGCSRNPALDLM